MRVAFLGFAFVTAACADTRTNQAVHASEIDTPTPRIVAQDRPRDGGQDADGDTTADTGNSAPASAPAAQDGGADGPLDAATAPLDANADAGPSIFVVALPTDGLVPTLACAAGLPPDSGDVRARVAAAEAACEGNLGGFRCTCQGRVSYSFAAECTGALLEQCGVRAEALMGHDGVPPRDCSARLSTRAGHCEPEPGAGFRCRCDGASDDVVRDEPTCERALWAACATACSDDFGSCSPTVSGPPGEHQCQCANGLTGATASATCGSALSQACNPDTETAQLCNGYGGRCERTAPDQLHCTCTDGTEHDAPYAAGERHRPCRTALEATCGVGELGPDELCTAEGNEYTARCEPATEARGAFACECVYRGPTADWVGLIDERFAVSCRSALQSRCPETDALASGDREAACQQLTECDRRGTYAGLTRAACLAQVGDGCVACVKAELARNPLLPNGCPDGNLMCVVPCQGVVPRDTAVAACELAAGDPFGLNERDRCLCDRCYPSFGECALDYDCRTLVECFQTQGCQGDACDADPVCGPMLERLRPMRSPDLAKTVSACPALSECWAL